MATQMHEFDLGILQGTFSEICAFQRESHICINPWQNKKETTQEDIDLEENSFRYRDRLMNKIKNRHMMNAKNTRPVSSWPSSVDRVKTSISPDLKDGIVPSYLSKSRIISSPFQNCRTGVILAFVC
ncbi:hypothetical protein V6N12_045212 [Hibiscus sabdariffa]|uniref:Uncharacterized protein n=1 Tax=Hibiscus sabdariffa TaxID=183260 RepID=A0ABR2G262_9ROSI